MRKPFRRIWARLIRSSDDVSVPRSSSGEPTSSDRLATWLPDIAGARFVVGANLPWIDYGTDFGTSAWHVSGGISGREASLARLEETLQTLGDDGIPLVRVFVLCDGRSGVRFDGGGLPIGLDDEVFRDFDALVTTASRCGVRLMPVLLDFHLCKPLQIVDGVQLGGRGHLIATVDGRAATIDHVVEPIVRRYGTHEAIAVWDVFNEPEWCLRLLPALSRSFDPFEAMQAFLRSAVSAVRAASKQPVTVGSAGTWQLDLVRPLGLDVYQIHWYERFGWRALEQPVAELGLDAPAILGEFSGRSDRILDVLHSARRAGYRGALVWSVLADDDQSGYSPEIAAWARAHGPGTALS
jgi:hypothetical protein